MNQKFLKGNIDQNIILLGDFIGISVISMHWSKVWHAAFVMMQTLWSVKLMEFVSPNKKDMEYIANRKYIPQLLCLMTHPQLSVYHTPALKTIHLFPWDGACTNSSVASNARSFCVNGCCVCVWNNLLLMPSPVKLYVMNILLPCVCFQRDLYTHPVGRGSPSYGVRDHHAIGFGH